MSDLESNYRQGIDRMDHPLSYMAAVVGGVAFIFVVGCVVLVLTDTTMLHSSNWWSVFVLSMSVIAVCLIGYFRPQSRAIYLPVLLAGIVAFAMCVWHFWLFQDPKTQSNTTMGFYKSLFFFGAWLAWAQRTFWRLRERRRKDSQPL